MKISTPEEASKNLKKWNKETEKHLKKRNYKSKKNLEEWTEDTKRYLKKSRK